jgi:Ras GTPase-activating protein 3
MQSNQVLTEHKTCEIDPTRLKDGESLATNMSNLKTYISNAFRSITSSALRCPQLMCELFTVLKELAIKYFPESREVCYYVISGFVFLRFFAPAILNPKLFEITDQQIVRHANRQPIKLIIIIFITRILRQIEP